MNNYVRPDTIHILGRNEQTRYQPGHQADYQNQPDSKPSRWEKFKAKAKRIWKTVMAVAEGIKDNIMPIVTGVGSFLTSWAAFCNRSCNRNSDRQWGAPAWAL